MKDRRQIHEKYTWDLEKIYSSIDEFSKDYSLVKEKIIELNRFEKNMTSSSDNFYNTIKLSFEIERILDKLSVYTSLSFDLDTSDNSKQELSEKISNLRSEYSRVSYFIVPSILKCDYSLIQEYYTEDKRLLDYEKAIITIALHGNLDHVRVRRQVRKGKRSRQ